MLKKKSTSFYDIYKFSIFNKIPKTVLIMAITPVGITI